MICLFKKGHPPFCWAPDRAPLCRCGSRHLRVRLLVGAFAVVQVVQRICKYLQETDPADPVSKSLMWGGSMRYFFVIVLLASTPGSAEVFVAGQQSAAGQNGTKPREPLADIPEAFRFLFHSPEQHDREVAKRPNFMVYEEELWKGLPYDSISLERGSTGGCVGACPTITVTLYRATVSGIRMPGACRTAPCPPGEQRGRAELRTVQGASSDLASLLPPQAAQTRVLRISEGSVRLREFAMLSYLLYKQRFLDLPNEYDCRGCPADRVYAVLSVTAGGKTKTVIDYGVVRPIELWAIQQVIESVSKGIQWTQK
jgi:hypothetical protein